MNLDLIFHDGWSSLKLRIDTNIVELDDGM